MKSLTLQPSLAEQAYAAIVDAICDGTIAPNTHLVQEQLAERLGVSRQPIQQALLLLRNDGVVEDAGRRGLIVAPLDLDAMRDRYQVRSALDELAARLAARRSAADPAVAADIAARGEAILTAGSKAAADADIGAMIASDVAFHGLVYDASGNAALAPTAEPNWRYIRRVMGEVYRISSRPGPEIWGQHRAILEAIVAGRADEAARLAVAHVEVAGQKLSAAFSAKG